MRSTRPFWRSSAIVSVSVQTRRSRNIFFSSASVFRLAATKASRSNDSQKQRLASVSVGAHSQRSRRDTRSDSLRGEQRVPGSTKALVWPATKLRWLRRRRVVRSPPLHLDASMRV